MIIICDCRILCIMDNGLTQNFSNEGGFVNNADGVLARVRQNFMAVGAAIAVMGVFGTHEAQAQCVPEREAYIAIDADSGDVLVDQDSQERIQPASMTKLMTLLLAYEAMDDGVISKDDRIYINKNRRVQRSSGWGGAIKFDDALKGAAIQSYNDLSITIGENVAKARDEGGTEINFVALMNEKAREIGMDSTRFYNASGLPRAVVDSERNGSTTSDMAKLLKHIADTQPALITLLGTDEARVRRRTLRSTNTLLRNDDIPYDAVSGKTGFTCDAGFSLTALVEKDGERVIFSYVGGDSPKDRESRVLEITEDAFDKLLENRVQAQQMQNWLHNDWNHRFPPVFLDPDHLRRGGMQSDSVPLPRSYE